MRPLDKFTSENAAEGAAMALSLYQRALANHEKSCGPEHKDTADCLLELAQVYCSVGQVDEAIPLNQRAMEFTQKAGSGRDKAESIYGPAFRQ